MGRRIPFAQPSLGAEEEQEVLNVLRSGWLTAGPRVREFEICFSKYIGSKYAVALNSATSALFLALKSLGVGAGDEVITTPFTFVSTASAIILTGAVPIFSDIEGDSLNLDPNQLESKITDKTRAILVVHFAGRPANLDAIGSIASKHGLPLIEDAAHAIGSSYKGRLIGSGGNLTAFSFYPTKNMTAAEGGMLVTDDEEAARSIRLSRWYGLAEAVWERSQEPYYDASEVLIPSLKHNMSDLQAAIGICQLRKLGDFNRIRSEYARLYLDLLSNVSELALPSMDTVASKSSWHLFVIRIKSAKFSRKDLCSALAAKNVSTSYHYKSLHLHAYFRGTRGFKEWNFPNAALASREVVSLPIYPKMDVPDVEYVAESVLTAVRELGRG